MGKKKNNLEANFSVHLLTDTVAVPKMLLTYYPQLGINEQELVVLLKVYAADRNQGLVFSAFGEERMVIPGLVKKKFVVIQKREQQEYLCLSWQVLFERLLELWVYQQSVGEETAALHRTAYADLQDALPADDEKYHFGELYQAFEQEFGRGLSPLETEKIAEWQENLGFRGDMILEALKRAVYRGKYSFAYIDTILHDWYKKNIRTPMEIEQSEASRAGTPGKAPRKPKAKEKEEKNKTDYSLVYQKK
ncbi:MAG: DnaD domain protein [Peptococcaceae bacterium]|nr:DnaD domain protein [Peptococcaceae bacterium]